MHALKYISEIKKSQVELGILECSSCKEIKGTIHFPPSKRSRFGFSSWCKECIRERTTLLNPGSRCHLTDLGVRKCPQCSKIVHFLHCSCRGICIDCQRFVDIERQQFECALGIAKAKSRAQRLKHPYRAKAYDDSPARREAHRKREAIKSAEKKKILAAGYIKDLLVKSNSALRHADIPQELVELKRMQIKIHREIKTQIG